jgi:hypothetical protein
MMRRLRAWKQRWDDLMETEIEYRIELTREQALLWTALLLGLCLAWGAAWAR